MCLSKTADNVTVNLDCAVVFRIMGDVTKGEDPELVRTFVHEVTPVGFQGQLTDALAEEVRFLARSLKHDEVNTCRTLSEEQVTKRSVAKAADAKAKEVDASFEHGVEMVGGSGGGAAEQDDGEEKSQAGLDQAMAMLQRLNKQFNPQVNC